MKSKIFLKLIVVVSSMVLCFITSGCQRKYNVAIDMVEGKFITPKGEFVVNLLAQFDDDKLYSSGNARKAPFYYLHGNDGDTYVSFGVLNYFKSVHIVYAAHQENGFDLQSINYEFKGDEYSVSFEDFSGSERNFTGDDSIVRSSGYIKIELPAPLAKINTIGAGGTLYKNDIEEILNNNNNIHRFVMIFYLNGSKYIFDISFRLALKSHWDIGVPGGMP